MKKLFVFDETVEVEGSGESESIDDTIIQIVNEYKFNNCIAYKIEWI